MKGIVTFLTSTTLCLGLAGYWWGWRAVVLVWLLMNWVSLLNNESQGA